MRRIRTNEFAIELDLSVEVWFGNGYSDVSIAVFEGGANEVVKRHFTWDELYDALDYEEPIERLREQAALEIINHKKAVLRRMKAFVREKGFQMAGGRFEGSITERTQAPQIIHIINGGLKSCIDAHGPITHATRNSAAKRIAKQFLATVQENNGQSQMVTAPTSSKVIVPQQDDPDYPDEALQGDWIDELEGMGLEINEGK